MSFSQFGCSRLVGFHFFHFWAVFVTMLLIRFDYCKPVLYTYCTYCITLYWCVVLFLLLLNFSCQIAVLCYCLVMSMNFVVTVMRFLCILDLSLCVLGFCRFLSGFVAIIRIFLNFCIINILLFLLRSAA